jgi:hypothetical protein
MPAKSMAFATVSNRRHAERTTAQYQLSRI